MSTVPIGGTDANETAFQDEDALLDSAIPDPASTGPISKETIAAVHRLRTEFSNSDGALNREQRKFQDLFPSAATTRVVATQNFFEILVLATKDAVRVSQEKGFGGDIFIAPKKGLWGKWAEEKDEQQIAEEEQSRKEAEESKAAAEERGKRRGGAVDMSIRGARAVDVQPARAEGTAAA